MASAPQRRFTVDEYLALEKASERKSEFYQGQIFAMAGASTNHNRIARNLIIQIGNRLRDDKNCEVFGSDQRLLVKSLSLYTYPDVVIACNPSIERNSLTNAKAIFEVLSESTESYDRGKKFKFYRNIESLIEYILVSQHEPCCERFYKQADGTWTLDETVGMESELTLLSLDQSIPLAEIYRLVDFTLPEDESEGPTSFRVHPQ